MITQTFIKTTSIHRAMFDTIEVHNIIRNIETNFIKITIFEKQIFCSRFKSKSHEGHDFNSNFSFMTSNLFNYNRSNFDLKVT